MPGAKAAPPLVGRGREPRDGVLRPKYSRSGVSKEGAMAIGALVAGLVAMLVLSEVAAFALTWLLED